jgi:tetratricopeptide (TPR) repeat protein
LNGGLLIYGIRKSKQRHALAYGILLYFLFLLPVSNLFFNTGIRLLESNLFHASFGFSIALAWLTITGLNKLENWSFSKKRNLINSLAIVLIILTLIKTWERNWDWKNDITLFMKDVKNSPNSVLILGNAGARWIDLADTKEVTGVAIPGQDPNVFNDYNGVLVISDEELKESGAASKREYALRKGIGYLERAVELHPRYVNGFLNLGLAEFKLDKHDRSLYYWKHAEYLYPDNPYLKNYYTVVNNIFMQKAKENLEQGDYSEAEKWYKYCKTIDVNNADAWRGLEETYKRMNLKRAEANARDKASEIEANAPKENQKTKDEKNC